MTAAEIQERTRAKLEEYSPFSSSDGTFVGSLIAGEGMLSSDENLDEVKPVYEYIRLHINEAADEMLMIIPIHQFSGDIIVTDDNATVTPDEITPHEHDTCGTIEKPGNFLRLHTLLMNSWERPVHNVIGMNHPSYDQQFNRYTRGTPQKPVVCYDAQNNLRYYTIKKGAEATIKSFAFIKNFNNTTNYPEKIGELISLNTARKVYDIFGNQEGSTFMGNEIKALLEQMQL